MASTPPLSLSAIEIAKLTRRRHGRVRCEYLRCDHGGKKFGYVVDLSVSGMRAYRRGWAMTHVDKDEVLNLTLKWRDLRLRVKARVVWVNKADSRRIGVGFEFQDLTPQLKVALHDLACFATDSLVIAKAQIEHDDDR